MSEENTDKNLLFEALDDAMIFGHTITVASDVAVHFKRQGIACSTDSLMPSGVFTVNGRTFKLAEPTTFEQLDSFLGDVALANVLDNGERDVTHVSDRRDVARRTVSEIHAPKDPGLNSGGGGGYHPEQVRTVRFDPGFGLPTGKVTPKLKRGLIVDYYEYRGADPRVAMIVSINNESSGLCNLSIAARHSTDYLRGYHDNIRHVPSEPRLTEYDHEDGHKPFWMFAE